MRKLLLECMMLRPLSARGVEELLGGTLAAAEAALCRERGPGNAPAESQQSAALDGLHACGFAALLQLNRERLVSGGGDGAPRGCSVPHLCLHRGATRAGADERRDAAAYATALCAAACRAHGEC